ncbi:MAG: ZIP family metal transporter [Elusimicrobia bacterium]|nr:ZIP family metal transporter [Elusimicrobiota bacterium]
MLRVFTALAVLMTFAGGLLPFFKGLLSRQGITHLFCLRAGILLSVSFTEILPEAWATHHAWGGWGALGAFVLLFVMGNFAMLDSCPEYLEECRVHYLGWTALLALSTHSFLDGFNLAVAFSAGAKAGLAVGLTLALHKLADGFTLISLFETSAYSRAQSLLGLSCVAGMTPLGALLSSWGFAGLPRSAEAGLMGFAAGSFIYIAAADILPRLHKKRDKAGLLYFSLGMFGMAALKIL